jgi:hypothetical protein
MTVTGVAMILGGIGIPIWFRREIFGVGGKRRVRASRGPRAIEAPRRAQLTAAPAHAAAAAELDRPRELSAAAVSGAPGSGPIASRRFTPARAAASQADPAEDVSVLEVVAPAELEPSEAEAAGSSRRSRRGRRQSLAPAGAAGAEPRAGTGGGRRHLRTAVREAGDDLDDRDFTGRFRYGLASIGLADDDLGPADDDLGPADDDLGPADDDLGPADDDLSPAEDDIDPAGDGASSVGDDHDNSPADAVRHEVDRAGDDSPDTGAAAVEVPARQISPDGHHLDDHERYFEEPGEPDDAAEHADAAPPARPRTWGDRRYGDRVDGWVRPQYHDLPQSEGAYWTPVPEAARYAGPFGWPIPVDRLPAVPDYEPATGFDLTPVAEPTAVVTQWPPAGSATEWRPVQPEQQWPPARQWPPASRLESPRSWPAPGGAMAPQEQPFWVAPEEEDERRPRRRAVMIRRGRAEAKRRGTADPTQALPPVEDVVKDQRPRPRPRPSTVYVSKHAAE